MDMIRHIVARDSEVVSGSTPIQDNLADEGNTITDQPAPVEDKPEDTKPAEKAEDKPEVKPADDQREQMYQDRMQKMLAYVAHTEPERLEEFKQAAKHGPTVETQPVPTETAERRIADMTPDELTAVLTSKLADANKASLLEIRRQESIDREKAQAGGDLTAMTKELGLTGDDLTKAINSASQLGIDVEAVGGYSRVAVAAARELKLAAFEKGLVQRTQEASMSAADQAREMVATAQPSKAASSTPKKETEEQKTLRRIQEVRGKPSEALLDSSYKK